MQSRICSRAFFLALLMFCELAFKATCTRAQERPELLSPPSPVPCLNHDKLLQAPVLSGGRITLGLPPAQLEPTERPLPINLATALRLAGARPIVIAAAEASVQTAAAQYRLTRVLWLPSFNVGAGYYRHDGATQGQSGTFYINSKDQFLGGAGLTAWVNAADALFAPLVARQVLQARTIDVQTARNDALLNTAEAYFNVQQARGTLAGKMDVEAKALAIRQAINLQAITTARPTDRHRALTVHAEFRGAVDYAREQWTAASADLSQILRLDPSAIVLPVESPDLRVTLISPAEPVDSLIPIGLTNRPELASQQALVQAALVRIRQERLRPLVPSLLLQGSPGAVGPGGFVMAGEFGSGASGAGNPWQARDDISVGLVWQSQNLGLGNRALVRERRAEQQELLVQLFRIQDMVAADIARSHGQIRGAAARVRTAEEGLEEAGLAYEGSINELGKVGKTGEIGVVVRRAFEVIDAVRALSRAYDAYFLSVSDYNRAQFRLYRALGYPAGIVAHQPIGPIMSVDTSRPPQMAPVCAPVH
jgi:outer membrane protein TolC